MRSDELIDHTGGNRRRPTTMTIYQMIEQATDADTAYYLARNTHRRRNDTIETQIYAAIGDATTQHRNGRTDLARTIAGIIANYPMSDFTAAVTENERRNLASLVA
jgi:hypothetical protein